MASELRIPAVKRSARLQRSPRGSQPLPVASPSQDCQPDQGLLIQSRQLRAQREYPHGGFSAARDCDLHVGLLATRPFRSRFRCSRLDRRIGKLLATNVSACPCTTSQPPGIEFLRGSTRHGISRSTGGPRALLGRVREQGRDFLQLCFGQQRTGSRHRPMPRFLILRRSKVIFME
jgi:hypothetical protein